MGHASDQPPRLLTSVFPPSLFPATRDELVSAAEAGFAEDWLISDLEQLPAGPFEDVTDVWNHLRAQELAEEVTEENPDPTTRREAIEQALEAEDLSEEGEDLGQQNE